MRAIDTNIVVRLLTNDDPDQVARARRVLETGDVLVSTTVLLEAEWVLRSAYGLAPQDILRQLRAFVGLPGITVEDPLRIADALDWAAQGLDFADALHLAGARGCDAFVTFDQRLTRLAATLSDVAVVAP